MNSNHTAFRFAVSVFVVVVFSLAAFAQREAGSEPPEVSRAVKFDISPPLRSITPMQTTARKAEDDLGKGPVGVFHHDPDPVVQTFAGTGVFNGPDAIPPTGTNFLGMTGTGSNPPDTIGDIGPNHYVQMVNVRFQIFNRSGVSLFGPASINTLFSGFGGPCQLENAGDPVVVYDQLADRWLLSQFSDSTGPFFNCVALSTSSDPLGTYFRYAFSAPTFPDYPKYAVWPDAYYINTREINGGVIGLYALDRAAMLAGNPNPQVVRFTSSETSPTGPNGLLNSDIDGTALPPVGSPNYVVGTRDNDAGAAADALRVYKYYVDWVTPANSTFTGPTEIPVAPFDSIFPCTPSARACIPQPGTATKIDILSYRQRPTWRLAYRNLGTHESMVTSQSVEATTGIAGMRWWEIRLPGGNPTLHQQGTYAPADGIHRWMGSIAMDKIGNMALGYSVSDATSVFPGIRYTGRLAGDPLGTMPQGEGTIVNGGGVQTSTGNRWGDYSSMNLDPTDDCTFWYTNEYYATTSVAGWSTRVASFKFPDCVATVPRSRADFDGDGKTDRSVFRPSEGNWYIDRSGGGTAGLNWGIATDTLVPGDWDGDGKADTAIFRATATPGAPDFYILNSNGFTMTGLEWGVPGDIPVAGDFNGDNRTEAAIFRPSEGVWWILGSSSGVQFGQNGDVPMVIDIEGDGRSNLATYRPSTHLWYIARASGAPSTNFDTVSWGLAGDIRAPADYDGNGSEDIAVFRPSNGTWYILKSLTTGAHDIIQFGLNGDVPVPGDYDGDGRDDVAIYRGGVWHVLRSTAGYTAAPWGVASDLPVPKAYIP